MQASWENSIQQNGCSPTPTPPEQTGVHPHRICIDRILALTTYSWVSRKVKNLCPFHRFIGGLRYRLNTELHLPGPSRSPIRRASLIDNMLSNRMFQVIMGNSKRRVEKFNNGLNYAIAHQHQNFKETELFLIAYLKTFRSPYENKTEAWSFHLNKR